MVDETGAPRWGSRRTIVRLLFAAPSARRAEITRSFVHSRPSAELRALVTQGKEERVAVLAAEADEHLGPADALVARALELVAQREWWSDPRDYRGGKTLRSREGDGSAVLALVLVISGHHAHGLLRGRDMVRHVARELLPPRIEGIRAEGVRWVPESATRALDDAALAAAFPEIVADG